ncbi:MAG: hypothetical protein ACE37F_35500 [Nannocystaceae bacterium]|nr:hypothetical protein [bacterium]
MKRPLGPLLPLREPSEGLVDMVFALFKNDPVEMMRYVSLGARVDSHLDRHGLGEWGDLDVCRFVNEYAATRAELMRLCTMLFKVLPWLVPAGELTPERAQSMQAELLELCPDAGSSSS